MRIAFITAGAAGRYCGNCLRDNQLALAMRRLGEDVTLVPTYTPIRTDEEDASEKRVFLGGLRVYLSQQSKFFRRSHPLIDRLLDSRPVLKSLSFFSSRTEAKDLGDLTISVLQGDEGRQKQEIDELATWLADELRPDVIQISNILLVGIARTLQKRVGVPVVCGLQAEDSYLDALKPEHRKRALELISERGSECDALVAVSRY
ncbi:MAG: hypothetical protein AAF517_18385 [Planctomycetota bacterium]